MYLVGVENALTIHGNAVVMSWAGTAGDQDVRGANDLRAFFAGHFDTVGIQETGCAFDYRDLIAAELSFDDFDLARHDGIGAEDQILHGDLVFYGIAAAVKSSLPQTA